MDAFTHYLLKRAAIYHGTTKHFLEETVAKHGRYKNIMPSFLTDALGTAMGYATERSAFYHSQPTVLAINTKLVSPRFIYDEAEPTIDYLNPDEYVSLAFGPDIDIVPAQLGNLFKAKFGMEMFSSRKTILYAEDDKRKRQATTGVIELVSPDAEIISAQGLDEALHEARHLIQVLDLIITDGELIDSTGWGLVERFRELGYTGPVIYSGASKIPADKRHLFDENIMTSGLRPTAVLKQYL